MAVTLVAEGTHTPSNTTAQYVTDLPRGAVSIVRIGLDPMQNGDTVRVYATGFVGMAPTILSEETFTDDQGDKAVELVVALDDEDYTGVVMLEQSAGTFRTFSWRVIQIG